KRTVMGGAHVPENLLSGELVVGRNQPRRRGRGSGRSRSRLPTFPSSPFPLTSRSVRAYSSGQGRGLPPAAAWRECSGVDLRGSEGGRAGGALARSIGRGWQRVTSLCEGNVTRSIKKLQAEIRCYTRAQHVRPFPRRHLLTPGARKRETRP